MGKSNIEWTDMVWNPVTGCTKVSEGCTNCYAERMAMRFTGHFNVTCHPDRLDQPLHWKKPRRIFVCSMGDLFHEDVPFEFIQSAVRVPWLMDRHIYMILTKRPERLLEFHRWIKKLNGWDFNRMNNIWLGVTAENQEQADKRIPILLQIPAAKRFVSIEPMLGLVDFATMPDYPLSIYREAETVTMVFQGAPSIKRPGRGLVKISAPPKLDWVIVGAESGPKRRECKLEWVRDIVGQGKAAGIPVFVKQLHINGKLSKNMDEWPEDLRVREYPG